MFLNRFRLFVKDESGSELAEYAIVMSVLTIGSLVSIQILGQTIFHDEQVNGARLQNTGVTPP